MFLIPTPILWHIIGKAYVRYQKNYNVPLRKIVHIFGQNRGLWKLTSCLTLTEAVVLDIANVDTCKLHYCFSFALLFQTRYRSKRDYDLNVEDPIYREGADSNFDATL